MPAWIREIQYNKFCYATFSSKLYFVLNVALLSINCRLGAGFRKNLNSNGVSSLITLAPIVFSILYITVACIAELRFFQKLAHKLLSLSYRVENSLSGWQKYWRSQWQIYYDQCWGKKVAHWLRNLSCLPV